MTTNRTAFTWQLTNGTGGTVPGQMMARYRLDYDQMEQAPDGPWVSFDDIKDTGPADDLTMSISIPARRALATGLWLVWTVVRHPRSHVTFFVGGR